MEKPSSQEEKQLVSCCKAGERGWGWGLLEPEPSSLDLKPVFFSVPGVLCSKTPTWTKSGPYSSSELGKSLIPHVHTATLSQEARNKFFFQATPCSHPCKTMYLLLLSLFHLGGENAYHMTPQSRAVPVYKYSTLIAL